MPRYSDDYGPDGSTADWAANNADRANSRVDKLEKRVQALEDKVEQMTKRKQDVAVGVNVVELEVDA
jgi:phage shock protein A